MTAAAKAAGHQHAEAFALMLYQGRESKRVVDVWNSRDGVTPFGMDIDGEEYTHIAFGFDRYAPAHKLRPGDYFWRDTTEDEARRIAARRVDHYSPNLGSHERSEAIEDLWREFYRHGDSPQPHLDRAPFITVVDHDRGPL
jgi:hypothetical protein